MFVVKFFIKKSLCIAVFNFVRAIISVNIFAERTVVFVTLRFGNSRCSSLCRYTYINFSK